VAVTVAAVAAAAVAVAEVAATVVVVRTSYRRRFANVAADRLT